MKILAIETSCDETALAVLDTSECIFERECVASQIALHRPFGGVVPGLATQDHFATLPRLMGHCCSGEFDIDTIAVTCGPGLVGCLALGIAAARTLGLLFKRPVVGINHLRGHLLSCFIPVFEERKSTFVLGHFLPHLGLLVSGGNTLLVGIDWKCGKITFEALAQTVDDAAGEALDKGARLLGLPYPGGPEIEKWADGDASAFSFPVAFKNSRDSKFSFSGLKTSLRYLLEREGAAWRDRHLGDLCASFQKAVVDALVNRTEWILSSRRWASLGVSGGVANNLVLRSSIKRLACRHGIPSLLPLQRHSGDNASMIAFDCFIEQLFVHPPKIFGPDPNRSVVQ
jgi:N6-L-threonylcarbamoyladenine synthase